ncbi:MAG TPA: [FeFe] hydrogenase, group A [Smithella sp.]|jgi:ferredoxin hydrogenase large subunit|nr:[FeFe] hydrogenase, group A [Smithella sp.]NMC96579.1 4Fe-4S binding protein [Deltaproteobacteria bacterium]OQC54646.1 MAG: Periplasmic (Fe) hydrogenase large subunit [Deltaproteobacteria bacterium ADurb.Bin022]HOG12195.1 [FeFe] hydrogenase, group A [Smithellaceae bacterium]HOQ72190.1 [FeFe] hydrogenase, group A [Smithellaceae bacterium]
MNVAAKTYQKGEIPGVIAIKASVCKGCDACKRHCPTGAITGMFGATHSINADLCLSCGQCLINCPFGAPYETSDTVDAVIAKLQDKNTTVVGIIAPAVRVAIGEDFGLPAGSLVTGKLYGSMRKAGFDILDNNFTADLTIMEEGSEFIARARHAVFGEENAHGGHIGPLPQFTSCCPAWVRFVETKYPALIPHLSSAKSPQQMAGTVAKTYGVKVWNKPADRIYTVGIMPCTAKKLEASRPEFISAYEYNSKKGQAAGASYPDVDTVLTTRDLSRLFKKLGINLAAEKEMEGGTLLADYTGAGTIFGNTGGVMEAALRTAYAVITGNELKPLEFKKVRGLNGVKSASVTIRDSKYSKDVTINVAVVHGIARNIAPVVDEVLAGRSPYHFIEVMNCPGGCINGGGQPIYGNGSSWIDAIRPWFAWR